MMRCLRCKGYVGGAGADCTCDTPVWTLDMLTPCGPPAANDQRLERIRRLYADYQRSVLLNEDMACGEWDDIGYLLSVIDGSVK